MTPKRKSRIFSSRRRKRDLVKKINRETRQRHTRTREFSRNEKERIKNARKISNVNQVSEQLYNNRQSNFVSSWLSDSVGRLPFLSRLCNNRRKRRRAIFAISRQGSGHKRPEWRQESRFKCN